MNITRRTVLKSGASAGVLTALLATGLLRPSAVFAADWNKAAFESKDLAGAMKGIGAGASTDSKDLVLTTPDIAENGAVVPISVLSNIPNTTSIAILVEKNPTPLSSSFDFGNGAVAEVAVRLKLGQTTNIRAVAKAGGKFYTTQKEVKVTVGGCGG